MDPSLEPALLLLGVLMPPIVAIIKQSGWSKTVNSVVALVVYLIAVVIYMGYEQIPFTIEAVAQNATALIGVGFLAYKMFWDAIGADAAITEKTTVVH